MNWFTDTIEGVTQEKWDKIVEFFKTDEGFNRDYQVYYKPNKIMIEYQSHARQINADEFEVLFDGEKQQITITYPVHTLFLFALTIAALMFTGTIISFFFIDFEEELHEVMRYAYLVIPWVTIFFIWAQTSSAISRFRNKYYFRMVATVEDKTQPNRPTPNPSQ